MTWEMFTVMAKPACFAIWSRCTVIFMAKIFTLDSLFLVAERSPCAAAADGIVECIKPPGC